MIPALPPQSVLVISTSSIMGYSLSWLAVKGKSPQAVRDALSFHPTGECEEIPESAISAAETPNGWYLIVANRREQVTSDFLLKRLSESDCEIVTCFVEEHVMVSQATGWRDGKRTWLLNHDCQQGLRHLEVEGDLPQSFAAIRDGLLAKQTEESCDYIFDIPVETARSLVGYRHDQDIPGMSGEVFQVLAEIEPINPVAPPAPANQPSSPGRKQSFLKKLFGG